MTDFNICPLCGQLEPPRDPNRPRQQEIWILQMSDHNAPDEFVKAWVGKPTLEQLQAQIGFNLHKDDVADLHACEQVRAGPMVYTLQAQRA